MHAPVSHTILGMDGLHAGRGPRAAGTVTAATMASSHPLAATFAGTTTASSSTGHVASSGVRTSHSRAPAAPSASFAGAAAGGAASDGGATLAALQRLERKVDGLTSDMTALRGENAALRDALMGLAVLEPLANRVEALTGLVKTLADLPRHGGAGATAPAALTDAGGQAAGPATGAGEQDKDEEAPKEAKGKMKIWVGSWNVGAEVRAWARNLALTLRAHNGHSFACTGPLRGIGGAEPR